MADRAGDPAVHQWDAVRGFPTTWDSIDRNAARVHESVFRSYQVLSRVREMLGRGDSPETVREFITWATDA